MAPKGSDSYNIFIRSELFPDPGSIFSWRPQSLAEIKDSCIVVLDTNVLLLPYTASSSSLSEISKHYRILKDENRLVVPAQVAREYAMNRYQKLGDLSKSLYEASSKNTVGTFIDTPIMASMDEYKSIQEKQKAISTAKKEVGRMVNDLTAIVRDWTWRDPVSSMYEEVFGGTIHTPAMDESDIEKDLNNRLLHKLPPGFKDESKDDRGVGDVIIWRSILELGETRKLPLIFVSGDEKSDWWHKTGGDLISPRVELVEEYRRASEGNTLHIVSLSSLLDLFGVDTEVVQDLKIQENVSESLVLGAMDSTYPSRTQLRTDEAELIHRILKCVRSVDVFLVGGIGNRTGSDVEIVAEYDSSLYTVVEVKSIMQFNSRRIRDLISDFQHRIHDQLSNSETAPRMVLIVFSRSANESDAKQMKQIMSRMIRDHDNMVNVVFLGPGDLSKLTCTDISEIFSPRETGTARFRLV